MAHPADGRGATGLMNGGINDDSMRPGGRLFVSLDHRWFRGD